MRVLLHLEANYQLSPGLALAGELSVRHSRYGKPHRWVESGMLVERRREDVLTGVGLMAEYDLTARWLLRPQWFFRHQQSELQLPVAPPPPLEELALGQAQRRRAACAGRAVAANLWRRRIVSVLSLYFAAVYA